MTLSPLSPLNNFAEETKQKKDENASKPSLPNPGMIEQLHKEVRDLFPTNQMINGAKFEMTKPHSSNFQVSYKFLLGPRNTFSFGPVFASESGLLMAEIDTSGNLSGQYSTSPIKNVNFKTYTQFTDRGNSAVFDTEYLGQDYSSLFRLINPDIATGSGVGLFQYFQSITPKVAVGVEATVQRGHGAIDSNLQFVGRYSKTSEVYTTNFTLGGPCIASYFRKVNENASFGAEIETFVNSQQRESLLTIGAKYDVRPGSLRFLIDTKGRLSSFLESRLFPGFSLLFSGHMDYWNGESKFGFGLTLGS